mmetsp:Transcript_44380/g.105109  ORF Transcript_44380/g.105109 Transcript_44380/m.105109 type:complete len:200 (+) Transcript_44380:133-732(+)
MLPIKCRAVNRNVESNSRSSAVKVTEYWFCANAAMTTSLSLCSSSCAYFNPTPLQRTAVKTTSLSALRLSEANSKAVRKGAWETAARTTSLSPRSVWDAYRKARPLRETAANTTSRSAWSSGDAYCNTDLCLLIAAITTSLLPRSSADILSKPGHSPACADTTSACPTSTFLCTRIGMTTSASSQNCAAGSQGSTGSHV